MSPLLAAVLPCIFGNLLLRVASAAAGSAIALNLAFMRRTTGDVDPTFVGWLAVAFYTSELVTAPFFGSLSDRFGRQRFMLLGTLLGIVAVLFLPFLPLLPLFLVARSLEGLSSGSSVPAVLGHLSVETSKVPQLRSRIMAGFEVATILGLALGYATAGIL